MLAHLPHMKDIHVASYATQPIVKKESNINKIHRVMDAMRSLDADGLAMAIILQSTPERISDVLYIAQLVECIERNREELTIAP